MKALFVKLALIIIGSGLVFELVFGLTLPAMVQRSKDSYLSRWRQFYQQPSGATLVCLGSSRIHRHCDPEIISAATHCRTEVIAIPGAKVDFFERMYKDWLQRNPRPKVLLVGIDLTGLNSKSPTPFPQYFYPFMKASDQVAQEPEFSITRYHKPLGFFYYKELYAYELEFPDGPSHIAGYLPSDATWQQPEWEGYVNSVPHGYGLGASSSVIRELFRFMKEEKAAGVTCVGVLSPEYQGIWKYENDRQKVMREVLQEAQLQGIRLFNFSDSSYLPNFNTRYFYDFEHMNKTGATVFSRDLADSLVAFLSYLHYPWTAPNDSAIGSKTTSNIVQPIPRPSSPL